MGVGEREHGEAHREVERADPEEAEALADADAAPGIGPVEPRPHRAESGGEADEPGDDDEETGAPQGEVGHREVGAQAPGDEEAEPQPRGDSQADDPCGEAGGTGDIVELQIAPVTEKFRPAFAPLDTSYNGGPDDAFVSEVTSDMTQLVYSGYLGSPGDDFANAIAVDGSGNAFVTGGTTSPQFPHVGAPGLTFNGGLDGFVAGLGTAGTISFSGFLGGGFDDFGRGIRVAPNGNLVVTGGAGSPDFPVSIEGKRRADAK